MENRETLPKEEEPVVFPEDVEEDSVPLENVENVPPSRFEEVLSVPVDAPPIIGGEVLNEGAIPPAIDDHFSASIDDRAIPPSVIDIVPAAAEDPIPAPSGEGAVLPPVDNPTPSAADDGAIPPAAEDPVPAVEDPVPAIPLAVVDHVLVAVDNGAVLSADEGPVSTAVDNGAVLSADERLVSTAVDNGAVLSEVEDPVPIDDGAAHPAVEDPVPIDNGAAHPAVEDPVPVDDGAVPQAVEDPVPAAAEDGAVAPVAEGAPVAAAAAEGSDSSDDSTASSEQEEEEQRERPRNWQYRPGDIDSCEESPDEELLIGDPEQRILDAAVIQNRISMSVIVATASLHDYDNRIRSAVDLRERVDRYVIEYEQQLPNRTGLHFIQYMNYHLSVYRNVLARWGPGYTRLLNNIEIIRDVQAQLISLLNDIENGRLNMNEVGRIYDMLQSLDGRMTYTDALLKRVLQRGEFLHRTQLKMHRMFYG